MGQRGFKIGRECDILQCTKTGDVELWYIYIAKGVDFVDARNCALDCRVGGANVVLYRSSDTAHRALHEVIDLSQTQSS